MSTAIILSPSVPNTVLEGLCNRLSTPVIVFRQRGDASIFIRDYCERNLIDYVVIHVDRATVTTIDRALNFLAASSGNLVAVRSGVDPFIVRAVNRMRAIERPAVIVDVP